MRHIITICLLLTACSDPPTLAPDPPPQGEDASPDRDPQTNAPDAPEVPEEPECRDPADCPSGQTCQAGECAPVPCANDEECGSGARCDGERCVEIGASPCEQDGDCGFRWRCSPRGVCIEPGCVVNADCAPQDWCRDGVCAPRRDDLGALRFERVYPEHLSDHRANLPSDLCEGCVFCQRVEAFGGALFDMDGDQDLDLFLSSPLPEGHSESCVYQNRSTPGALTFEPVSGLCGGGLGATVGAASIDLEQDGVDELVVMGYGRATLERFAPERSTLDLLDLLPQGDPRRRCMAGAMVATDLDLDGLLDIVIGCQLHVISSCREVRQDFDAQHNIALRQGPDGQFEALSTEGDFAPIARHPDISLALAVLDFDEDGLSDLLLANDDLTPSGQGGGPTPPGVALRRCAPGEPCTFEPVPFGTGRQAGGSFMGFGHIHVEGLGDHIYISDWGANRLVRFEDEAFDDLAEDLGVALATQEGALLNGWGIVIDDFDRNGLDDIYLAQGATWPGLPPEEDVHHDIVLLQRLPGPEFVLHTHDQIGLSPNDLEDALEGATPWGPNNYSSRGALKADLDGDGTLELLTAGLLGALRVHVERPDDPTDPPRCTLIPRTRTVPAHGHSHAIAPEGSDQFRRRDLQGQMRFGAPPSILTPENRGRLRFPSGAIVPFDCEGTPGPITLQEPDWIHLTTTPNTLTLTLDTPWRPTPPTRIALALRDAEGAITLTDAQAEGEGWRADPGDAQAVMIGIDGVWVARWFDL